jgi:NarL family two-component system response regulator LiaR
MAKTAKSRRQTVCLLSGHPMVLVELQNLLAGAGFHIAQVQLRSTLPPDLRHLEVPRAPIYVLDALTPQQATEALVAGILEGTKTARLLVVGEKFDEDSAFPLLRLGVKGLLTFPDAREQLSRAIQQVAAGGYWVPRFVLSRFVDSILQSDHGRLLKTGTGADLSRREQQVLDSLLQNLSNKEIANQLNISERTVKFHVSNLLAKYSVRRRADLIIQCFQRRPFAL